MKLIRRKYISISEVISLSYNATVKHSSLLCPRMNKSWKSFIMFVTACMEASPLRPTDWRQRERILTLNLPQLKTTEIFYPLSPIYMYSGASDFCHLQLILPGSPTNFEIGIFLSLCLILCNVKSVSRMLKKSDRRPGKIGRTAKIRPILAVLCKQPFTGNF